jgi:predicted lipoprotein with Yx(FWY)xxD motif
MSNHQTSRKRRFGFALVGLLAAGALIAGACNDDDDNDVDDTPTLPGVETPADTPPAETPDDAVETPDDANDVDAETTIAIAEDAALGQILTDAVGFTLYTFAQDVAGSGMSACVDGCADIWPPLTVDDEPTAPAGATGELGTIERDDGTTQVTYEGLPLYLYVQDESPGDTNGHEVGQIWFVATP